ncbi:DUF2303 family protein [Rhodococcus erythropolis]|uniref:DUF2303 family protein n=1 Tax=Rhodococcus erythropolis TaxID=1833 RepID=UPI0024BAD373|nr:DUF2303 family protein [Rhodococcus erythropolis]MDJ0403968.1 DUF2303 family protein [Rhodococcus erythropolis]
MSTIVNSTGQNEAQVIADLALDTVDRAEAINPDATAVQSYVIGDNERIHVDSFEKYLIAPRRPHGETTVTDTDSFVRLVAHLTSTFGDPTSTAVFADVDRNTVTAILNHHDWKDHRVKLALPLAPEWELWNRYNNKLLSQTSFAQLLQDGRAAIISPTAADLMEIATTFRAKRNVSFESGVRLDNGDVNFQYTEETKATAGTKGQIAIPEKFVLQVPVFLGGVTFPLEADLKYRAESGGLELGYRLDNPELVLREAFSTVLAQINLDLGGGYLMLQGTAPQPVSCL